MFSTMNEQALSRREVIVGAGALAALAGLAGCSGDGDGAGSMGVGDSGSAAARTTCSHRYKSAGA